MSVCHSMRFFWFFYIQLNIQKSSCSAICVLCVILICKLHMINKKHKLTQKSFMGLSTMQTVIIIETNYNFPLNKFQSILTDKKEYMKELLMLFVKRYNALNSWKPLYTIHANIILTAFIFSTNPIELWLW